MLFKMILRRFEVVFMPPPAPKVPEALCFRVVRPSVRPDLRPDFFVYAITQVLLDGISSNLVQGSTTRSR